MILLVAAAVAAPAARADVVPESYRALLERVSIDLSEPDSTLQPLLPAYDAHWLARVLHGQAYLVRYARYELPAQDAWLIVEPHVVIPRLGGHGGPLAWCGIAFHFIDARSAAWVFTAAIGTAPAPATFRC